MTGLISAIKRMEIHDGDGLRTTVFFKGCSLSCVWCHNPESIAFEKQLCHFSSKCVCCGSCASACPQGAITLSENGLAVDYKKCTLCASCTDACPTEAMVIYGKEYTVQELADVLAKDKPFFDQSGGGVTLSGGECLAQPEFAIELARLLCERGISVDIDSCGQVSRTVLERILPYVDTFLYDVKAVSPKCHKRCTGHTNERILENLRFLSEQGARIEIRYPLVMGYNDGECAAIGALLQNMKGITKVKVLQYHPFSASRYEALGLPCAMPDTVTTVDDVQNAVDLLASYGLRAVNGAKED